MPLKEFTGGAVRTNISGDLAIGALSITIQDATGWPTGGVNGPFTITIDQDLSNEETILIDSRSGNTLTVNTTGRGYDDTSDVFHSSNAPIHHSGAAEDFTSSNNHIFASPAPDDHDDPATGYMRNDGTRHDLTARHSVGTVVPAGVPGTIAPDDVAAEGVATTAARSDHTHAIVAAAPTELALADVTGEGVSTSFARADHAHGFASSSVPVLISETAPTSPITGQLWSRPSTLGLHMWNGSAWVMIGSATQTASVLVATTVLTSSTSYSNTGTLCSVAFVAPSSGEVLVDINCDITTDSNITGFTSFAIRTGGTLGSGTIVAGPDDSFAIQYRDPGDVSHVRAAATRHVTGLTAGSTYNCTQMHKVGGGGGAFAERTIIVQPIN